MYYTFFSLLRIFPFMYLGDIVHLCPRYDHNAAISSCCCTVPCYVDTTTYEEQDSLSCLVLSKHQEWNIKEEGESALGGDDTFLFSFFSGQTRRPVTCTYYSPTPITESDDFPENKKR